MDPASIIIALKAARAAGKGWQAADAKVAACAEEQGISKEEAWADVRADLLMRRDEALEEVLDLADPLGWRAAAKAMEQAERDNAS